MIVDQTVFFSAPISGLGPYVTNIPGRDVSQFVVRAVNSTSTLGTTLTAGVDYTINNLGPDTTGAYVTLLALPADADTLTVMRQTPLQQPRDIGALRGLPADVMEEALDYVVMAQLEGDERTSRALRVAPGSTVLGDLPDLAAGQTYMMGPGNQFVPGPSYTEIQGAKGEADRAQAGATAAALSALAAEATALRVAADFAEVLQRIVIATLPNYAAILLDTELTYEPTSTNTQVYPGMAVITRHGTYVIVDKAAAASKYHAMNKQGVKLREAGPLFTSLARLQNAYAEGDRWPIGTILFAGSSGVLISDGSTGGPVLGLSYLEFDGERIAENTLPLSALATDAVASVPEAAFGEDDDKLVTPAGVAAAINARTFAKGTGYVRADATRLGWTGGFTGAVKRGTGVYECFWGTNLPVGYVVLPAVIQSTATPRVIGWQPSTANSFLVRITSLGSVGGTPVDSDFSFGMFF